MKRTVIIALAMTLFSGCTKNGYLLHDQLQENRGGVITFNGESAPVTKSVSGADAATLLGGSFIVYGSKNNGSTFNTVFDGYKVQWVGQDSAATVVNAWEYIGQHNDGSDIQGAKYWDYNAEQYTFIAFSKGGGNAIFSAANPANIGTSNPIYTVSGQPNNDQLYPVYLAEPVQVNRNNYGKGPVSISFRPFRTKVRFGIYETIPGYSVENVCFYHTSTIEDTGGNYPVAITDDDFLPNRGEFAYSVYSSGEDGRLTVQCSPAQGVQYKRNIAFDTLAYSSGGKLGTTSADASYFLDSNGSSYINVLPTGDNSGKLGIRVSFTLVPLDGSDSHKITVKDAMAFIPEEYIKWQPGYVYTYLFKISDATGGLYPITFDAKEYLASDPLDTETIEGSISITSYQKGSSMEDNGAYNTTDNIYVTVGDYLQLQKQSVGQNGYVQLYRATGSQDVTEKMVQNCLTKGNFDSSTSTYTITDAAGHTLSLTNVSENMSISSNIPGADVPAGNEQYYYNAFACISGQEAGTYVFVYKPDKLTQAEYNTLPKGAPCYSFKEELYDNGNTYYMDYFTATGSETYNAAHQIVKNPYLDNDYMYPITDNKNDWKEGYTTSSYMLLDSRHYYYYFNEGYYYEMPGYTNIRVSQYEFYRLYPATYFTEYRIGDIIETNDIYYEKFYWLGQETAPIIPANYSFYKYKQNTATEPIEITADNVNTYVYLRKGTHKVNNNPFYSVNNTNNTKLLSDIWYWAVDGYDDYENDDGTYDDSTHIYVEEKKSTGDFSQQQWDEGNYGELIEVVEWDNGTYGEWYYSDSYTTDGPGSYKDYLEIMYGFYDENNDFCTIAPLKYTYCDNNGKELIYNADGTEMRGDVGDRVGTSELYIASDSAVIYSKVLNVR